MNHTVSIITPCYNGAAFIEETIRSVLAQSYQDWEWIIVDDGSTDESAKIVDAYVQRDGRIRLIRQENAGSAAARNAGIHAAKGRYICLLDADDVWDKGFLEKQLSFMKDNHAACVCCAYRFIDEESNVIGKPTFPLSRISRKEMLVKNEIGCLTGLYDTKNHGKIYLDESLKSVRDDYAYWLTIVTNEGAAFGNQEVLASYRVRTGSVTGNKRKLIAKQYHFYRDYLHLSVPQSVSNIVRWGIAGIKKFHS